MMHTQAFGSDARAMADDDARDEAGVHAAMRRQENAAAARRKERLAEQLRANLQRRKQQARARRAGEADERQGLDDVKDAPKR